MPRSFPATLIGVKLNPASRIPLYQQLFEQLRAAILRGELKPGTRLPATRDFVGRLDCSRSTVLLVFEILAAEGYVESRQGSGTYVAQIVPDALLASPGSKAEAPGKPAPARVSAMASRLISSPIQSALLPHSKVIFPDTREFPHDLWSLLYRQVWRKPEPETGSIGPLGHLPLRQAIAEYLKTVRSLDCDASQIAITSGASNALSLLFQLLVDSGDKVWIEDPSPPWIAAKVSFCDATPAFVPVDNEGIDVGAAMRAAPDARVAMVTPSHQAPLGTVLSLRRRAALLEWANVQDSWIIEDDYDSEFRYSGRPLPTLYSLDRSSRVFYVATFSKVLLPSLRLGYIVLPPQFIESFTRMRALQDRYTSEPLQPVLARFIAEGHFASHVRRMRRIYQDRRDVLLAEAEGELSGLLRFAPSDAGIHILADPDPSLPACLSVNEIADIARDAGLPMTPLSTYSHGSDHGNRLILGYAQFTRGELLFGVRKFAASLRARLAG